MGFLINGALFLAGLLILMQIQVVGTLFGTEIVLLALLPLAFTLKRRGLTERRLLLFIGAALTWLAAQVLTDIVRDTPFEDFSRGWAKIFFFLVNTLTLYFYLYDRPRRAVLFGLGLGVGQIVGAYINPSDFYFTDPWKFGYGQPLTIVVVMIVAVLAGTEFSLVGTAVITLMGLLNAALGYRSLGLVCIATAVFLGLSKFLENRKIGRVHFWVASAATGIALLAALQGYQSAAAAGWFGSYQQDKTELQSEGEFGIFLGGRQELLASLPAIADSPILGHGSWAKDPFYRLLMMERSKELGYRNYYLTDLEAIPSHSFLFGAWVESGVVGALVWLWMIVQSFGILRQSLTQKQKIPLMPFVVFSTFLLVWNILYSPFGAEHRVISAFSIAIILVLHSKGAHAPAVTRKRKFFTRRRRVARLDVNGFGSPVADAWPARRLW